jgi:hypothetical protein
MIPSLHVSGVIIPGVFGPIMVALWFFAAAITWMESFTGTCSVIMTTVFSPDSIASNAASAAKGAGMKIIEAFAS